MILPFSSRMLLTWEVVRMMHLVSILVIQLLTRDGEVEERTEHGNRAIHIATAEMVVAYRPGDGPSWRRQSLE